VRGKVIEAASAEALAAWARPYAALLLDVGTGDGKHAYRYARQHPDTGVIGIDASAENLREQSFRASRKPSRGGISNVLYLRATIEELPGCLTRRVDAVHILLPWGVLLQQVIRPDDAFLQVLRTLAAPAATVRIVLNTSALSAVPQAAELFRDLTADGIRAHLEEPYTRNGILIATVSAAHAAEADDIHTSWARRMTASPLPGLLSIEAEIAETPAGRDAEGCRAGT